MAGRSTRAEHPLTTIDQATVLIARRNARWYFTGLAASLVGNSAMSLVAGIWVKSLTGSSAEAGLVSACGYAPTMVAPLAGLLADRLPRTRLLFWLNLAGAAAILPLLLVRSASEVWIVFVVMTLIGIQATLNDPAEDALFAQMFTPEFRRRINGWRLTIQETGRLASPLLGAALFLLLGGGTVAALDSATFVLATLVITRLRVNEPPARPDPERLRPALSAGLHHIWTSTTSRPVALAATAIMAISGVGVAAQYSLVHAIGQRPAFLGVLSAALGSQARHLRFEPGRCERSTWRSGPRVRESAGQARPRGSFPFSGSWLPTRVAGPCLPAGEREKRAVVSAPFADGDEISAGDRRH
jgi:MFS family permease